MYRYCNCQGPLDPLPRAHYPASYPFAIKLFFGNVGLGTKTKSFPADFSLSEGLFPKVIDLPRHFAYDLNCLTGNTPNGTASKCINFYFLSCLCVKAVFVNANLNIISMLMSNK